MILCIFFNAEYKSAIGFPLTYMIIVFMEFET